MVISRYFVYFIVFSLMGWLYECTYCTITKGRWDNRGFLYGPIVPIYGVGAASLVGVAELLNKYAGGYTWWQVFLIGYFGSIVLEYSTSWALEKLFHAYWWDYSNLPFNIKGRVCLPCSLGFGAAALLVLYVIAPATLGVTDKIPELVIELLSLLFMAVIAGDATLTVSALTHFERNVVEMESALNTHMDSFVEMVMDKKQAAGTLVAEEKERFSKENMEKFFAEEKERFSKEALENFATSMNGAYKSALSRVQGFKGPKVQANAFNKVADVIKKHVPNKLVKKSDDKSEVI